MMMIAILTIVITPVSECLAGSQPRLIEVSADSAQYVGRVIAVDSDFCHLMDRFGRIDQLPVASVKTMKVVSEQFRTATPGEMREKLRREFPGYETSGSTHYLVVAPRDRVADYATLFEGVFRQVEQFFRVRGFRVTTPDNILVAVVFGTREEFEEYCRRDDVASPSSLRGYYSLRSNRVALFDDSRLLSAVTEKPAGQTPGPDVLPGMPGTSDNLAVTALLNGKSVQLGLNQAAAMSSETANVIIHEATHQVGHNIGIHSRMNRTPSWLMEGLATVLEAPGMRDKSSHPGLESRLNSERLHWFQTQYESRRRLGDIARIVADEEMFSTQVLDAYSAAWALTYFMSENPARTTQFARYIRIVESRDPTKLYSPEDRLRDFQTAFGDIARLEVEFLRFMDRMSE